MDIHNDGEVDVPHTWSVQQLAEHLDKNSALKDVPEVFVQHKLAGDIIMDMDLTLMTSWLPMSALQKITFKKEITALRKIIAGGPKDDVAHCVFLLFLLLLTLQAPLHSPTWQQVCLFTSHLC